MRTSTWIVPALALGLLGCQSNPFGEERHNAVVVDDELVCDVPEADREDILRARAERNAERNEMNDRVVIAERDVEQGRRQLQVAKEELEAAEAAVRKAEKSLAVAREENERVRASEMESASRRLESARARLRCAHLKVAHHATHSARLEAQVGLAKTRLERAAAQLELSKARALHELGRPETSEVAMSEFEAPVARTQVQVTMAEIDAEAWEKKVLVCREALDFQLACLSETRDRQD
jgi:hypothetical protein